MKYARLTTPTLSVCLLAGMASAQTLSSDVPIIDSALGGTQHLSIQGSPPGLAYYLVVGSASGTTPGLPLAPGVLLPLNLDTFTNFTLNTANGAIFKSTFGVTNTQGAAAASIVVPPIPGGYSASVNFAFVQLAAGTLAITGASNAVPLLIQPNVAPYITASASSAVPGAEIVFETKNGFDITPADDDTDFCVAFMPDETSDFAPNQWIGLDVIQVDAQANKLVAKVPQWFDAALPLGTVINGKIGMAKGEGNLVLGTSAGFITKKVESGWAWEKATGGQEAMMVLPFQLIAGLPVSGDGAAPCTGLPKKTLVGFKEANVGPAGEDAWCIVLPNPNLAGNVKYECLDQLKIRPRFWSSKNANGTPAPKIGYDADIGCHVLDDDRCVAGDKFSVGVFAGEINVLIQNTYAMHVPPIYLSTLPIQTLADGSRKLCYYLPGRDFDAGQFSITLYD